MSPPGIEPATPRFLSWCFRLLGHADGVIELQFKLLHYFGILFKPTRVTTYVSNWVRFGMFMQSSLNYNR